MQSAPKTGMRNAVDHCLELGMGCRFRMEANGGKLGTVLGDRAHSGSRLRHEEGGPNLVEITTTCFACLSFVIGGVLASVTVLDQGA